MSDNITVRLTEDGPVRMRGNGRVWERGETRDVSPERADALLEAHDFIAVVEDGDGDEDAGGDDGEDASLEDMTHDELKEIAEDRGIADEIDLRSKDSIIDALED